MKPRRRRLLLIAAGMACAGLAAALVLNAFRSNLVFFYTPTQVVRHQVPIGQYFRIGGLVRKGSLERTGDGVTVRFMVTDTARRVAIEYHGVLPDLFKEGKGVVAQGRLGADGVFHADRVLAKHDASYMPPEAAAALREADAKRAGKTPQIAARVTP